MPLLTRQEAIEAAGAAFAEALRDLELANVVAVDPEATFSVLHPDEVSTDAAPANAAA